MMIIKNARIVDPAGGSAHEGDLYIKDGRLCEPFDESLADRVIDARGLAAAPGLVDLHVHLRDPGQTHKEDIVTGCAAAAAGGVTTLLCMPNTSPVLDSPELIRCVIARAASTGVKVRPCGAVTVGQEGRELTDFKALKGAGAAALSDDGRNIDSASVMREALKKAGEEGLLIIAHCEDSGLAGNRAVNEGPVSKALGLPGRPAIAEELIVARDAMLAKETGGRLHIAHVSSKGSVDIIRRAKAAGVNISAETCPQYFTLTESAVLEKGTLARVNPPLRTDEDVRAIIEGLRDGTLDAVSTDHAPHSAEEKSRGLENAPSGMVGLETSLALALTRLCGEEGFTLESVIRLMSANPAAIAGVPGGSLKIGSPADIVLFDPDEEWTVEPEKFKSRARNTPFGGFKLRGRVKYTIADGKTVYGG
ncbi:MAG: dihydroorotase [Oscillospiraceae bacterium]|nr:dihydroorotase [Oscillospiraceae bacterium]